MFRLIKNIIRGLRMYLQGEYVPKNPNKCLNLQMKESLLKTGKGNVSNLPFARSSWEKRIFSWCDCNDNIKRWGSECFAIEYIMPDKSLHKYYPDIYFEAVDVEGNERKILAEVKPNFQTQQPRPPKTKNARSLMKYKTEVDTYVRNMHKWKFAQMWAEDRGMEFRLITEKELFGDKKR